MGGIGTGRYYRWNSDTTKTEEVRRVDIRFLKMMGYLSPGARGSLSWNCRGEPAGGIRFETKHDAIHLIYKQRRYGEDWQDRNERIAFNWTPCNYGGERQWLICPHCGRRVAVIYGLESGFLCRHCYSLPYSSQSEGHIDRMMRKGRKISKRIENENGYFEKPKGMHWKTYDMLVKQERDISIYVDTATDRLLSSYRFS